MTMSLIECSWKTRDSSAVKPFRIYDSPWNKASTIQATPATSTEVKELCKVVFEEYGLMIGDVVVNDIWNDSVQIYGYQNVKSPVILVVTDVRSDP